MRHLLPAIALSIGGALSPAYAQEEIDTTTGRERQEIGEYRREVSARINSVIDVVGLEYTTVRGSQGNRIRHLGRPIMERNLEGGGSIQLSIGVTATRNRTQSLLPRHDAEARKTSIQTGIFFHIQH